MTTLDQINYFKAIKICAAIQEMDKKHIPYSSGVTANVQNILEKRKKLMSELQETGFTLSKAYGYFPVPVPEINVLGSMSGKP